MDHCSGGLKPRKIETVAFGPVAKQHMIVGVNGITKLISSGLETRNRKRMGFASCCAFHSSSITCGLSTVIKISTTSQLGHPEDQAAFLSLWGTFKFQL
jgi:hypothetical protein